MNEALKYAWKEIIRRKKRCFWKIVGYLLMVLFFSAALSVASVSKGAFEDALRETGAQFAAFILSDEAEGDPDEFNDSFFSGFYVHNNPTSLFPLALIEKLAESKNIRYASPFLSFRFKIRPGSNLSVIVGGFEPGASEAVRSAVCSATDIVSGRLLQPGDKKHVMLEETFARSEKLSVGQTFTIGNEFFQVAGILSPGTRPAKADIYMPIDESIKLIETRLKEPLAGRVNMVLVHGISSTASSAAIADTKSILGERSTTVGYGCFDPASKAIGMTQDTGAFVTKLVLFSVVLLIFIMQYSSVYDRKKDMGILKAIGWSDRVIMGQILSESMIQAVVGAFAGSILAALLARAVPMQVILRLSSDADPTLSPLIVLGGAGLTTLTGLISGGLSSLAVLRIRPADIFRKI